VSLRDFLVRAFVAECHARWCGEPSPLRTLAASLVELHGLDLVVMAADWFADDKAAEAQQDAERDIRVSEKGPTLAKTFPTECMMGAPIDDRSDDEVLAEIHGAIAAHRGPYCAKCKKRVKQVTFHVTDATPDGHSAAATFWCHGETHMVVFEKDQPDEMLGPWCRLQTVFEDGGKQ
jgi:hypothetical protein